MPAPRRPVGCFCDLIDPYNGACLTCTCLDCGRHGRHGRTIEHLEGCSPEAS